tara:strand:+ start:5369 stop:5770 length:402 start_codon:yes stop_codon:yes gene_type:complete
MQYASLWRRIIAIIYDLILVISILFLMSLPLFNFNLQEDIFLKIIVQIYFYLIIQYFFVWFWVNKQGTLGMRTWKLKIVDINGNKISYKKAILRFNVAIISILFFGFGFIISIFHKDKKCLHDIISKTFLIKS